MVWEAMAKRATDIHLEPTEDKMLVRLRIDGMMTNTKPFSRTMGDCVVNIFKVLCNLDITEKRKPQDGSFSAQVGQQAGPGDWRYRLVDFRVATAGSVAGEKLVMRILDSTQQLTDLSQVGMTDAMHERNPRHRHPAARPVPGVRTDRLGQEHHAVRLPARDRPLQPEHHHGREPRRISPRQCDADRGQSARRARPSPPSCAASCGKTPT